MKQFLTIAVWICLLPYALHAETGAEAWLRYAPLGESEAAKYVS